MLGSAEFSSFIQFYHESAKRIRLAFAMGTCGRIRICSKWVTGSSCVTDYKAGGHSVGIGLAVS